MELITIYNERHGSGFENSIVKDPYDNTYYSILYNPKNKINIIFNSQDELYQFNYVGNGVKRAYLSDSELDSLFSDLKQPFSSYLEWLIDVNKD